MKKLLSILALLMVSAFTFAKDYTANLNYTILGYPGTLENIVASITSSGTNKYNVVIKDVDASAILGLSLGDLTIKNLEGKTENGVTTIKSEDVQIASSAIAPGNIIAKELTVKFDDQKAYIQANGTVMDFATEFTFGEDNFTPSAINGVNTEDNNKAAQIYSVSGAKVEKMQKGINILRLENGKTVKVVKK